MMLDIGVIIRCLGYFRFVKTMKGLFMKCLWELFVISECISSLNLEMYSDFLR